MIESNSKITVDNTDEGSVISIYPQLDTWQLWTLRLWLIAWVLLGMLAIMGMLKAGEGDQLLYAMVFGAFWLYFVYFGARSLVWHQSGREYLRIGEETLDYKRSWSTYGRAVSYDLATIKELGLVNLEGKSFAKSYQNAFWTVGGEQIGFEYLGRKVVLGLRLEENDAKMIIQMITKAQRK